MSAPELVNAHTHLYSGLAPLGLPVPEPPPANFLEILARVWWRLDRALDERILAAAARCYVADAIAHETSASTSSEPSRQAGATERNGGRDEARRGLAECRRFILSNRRPLVRGMVGVHACFTVSDDTLREAGALCRDLGVPLHVHVAEDATDVADARARGYADPIARLDALGALAAGSVLAHGVHLDERAVRGAESAGAWIVQNPRSNLHNRVGYPHALGAGRRIALGTDGFPSDMRIEAQALEDIAAQHGDARARAERRLEQSRAIVLERFGTMPLRDHGATLPGLSAILEESHREAQRLWARMREL